MKLKFTEKLSLKMYDALTEIHSLLQDKAKSKNHKLTIYEQGWLKGINKLLNEINSNNPS